MTHDEGAHYPFAHRMAYAWSCGGWRGSSYVWRLADQVGRRLSGVIQRPDGVWLHANTSDWTAKTAYEGTYERPLVRILPSLVQLGDAVVDVGANIGFISAVVAPSIGRTGLILQVEPSDYCVGPLAEIDERLQPETVIVKAAAGRSSGQVGLWGHDNSRHRGLGKVAELGSVSHMNPQITDQITLDSLVDLMGARRVGLLKVDVEGYEPEVLAGGQLFLSRLSPRSMILEVSPNFGDVSWVESFIEGLSANYSAFAVDESGTLRRRPRLTPVTGRSAAGRREQWNLLLTSDTRRIRQFFD